MLQNRGVSSVSPVKWSNMLVQQIEGQVIVIPEFEYERKRTKLFPVGPVPSTPDIWKIILGMADDVGEKRIQPPKWDEVDIDKYDWPIPYLPHQKEPIQNLLTYSFHFLKQDMGLGKTFEMVNTMRILRKYHGAQRFLVCCPRTVILTWLQEIKKFGDGVLIPFVVGENFPVPNRGELIKNMAMVPGIVIITNYETFRMPDSEKKKKGHDQYPALVLSQKDAPVWDVAAFDESTKVRNTATKAWKGMMHLVETGKLRRRYLMSGYAAPQGPGDYVGQYALMHPAILGYKGKTTFEQDFAQRDYQGRITGWSERSIKMLQNKMSLFATVQSTDDANLDLPERIYKQITVPMAVEQRKMYETLANQMVAWHEGEMAKLPGQDEEYTTEQKMQYQIVAKNFLSMVLKLSQITGGYFRPQGPEVFNEETGEFEEQQMPIVALPENPKLDYLEELCSNGDIKKPFIVCARFRHEIDAIASRLGNMGKIYGGMSLDRIGEVIEDCRAGRLRGIVLQPEAGGWGLNLQFCKTMIFYSNDYKSEPREQALKRVHRYGQKERVLIIDLTCETSVDNSILAKLREKKDLYDETTRGIPMKSILFAEAA